MTDDAAGETDSATAATKREGREPHERRAPAERDHLARGTLVGRYVVTGVLGEGGMGVVYAGHDPELDRKVAIKLLQAEHDGSVSGGQAWLLREAQAMARVSHPNVIAVYDVGTVSGDQVFVAMELVQGVTLRAWLREPRTWREVVAALRAAGAGLAAAHAVGLVHRDFKPENVLVGDDRRVRVMDFGLARLHADGEPLGPVPEAAQLEAKSPLSERLTAAGAVVGTPAYIAPEIYGGAAADARADQFAFGVVLYEALYRERPYTRDDLVARRAVAPSPPASADVPARLERVALRAIALDPAQRFASMDELLAELAIDPAAARRRVLIGAAGVLACGGIVVGALALRGERGELCGGVADKVGVAWNANKRAAIETAFHKIGKPFADTALRATEKALDDYATGWAAMRTEACQATRVRGDQSDDVLDLRMECLDGRLVELTTLVDLFGRADAALVSRAVASAEKLSAVADCADVAALRAPDPLPKDPARRAQLAVVRGTLAEARALYHAGQLKDARARAEGVIADAKRLDHQPTEAAIDLIVGSAKWQMSRGSSGETELLDAARLAETGKTDTVKLEAWIALVNLAADAARFDVALERWRYAAAALARLGDPWQTKVRLLATLAVLHMRKGAYPDALAAAHDARVLAEQHERGKDRPSYGYARAVEASVLGTMGRSEDAIAAYRDALPYKEALGPGHVDLATTLANLAGSELDVGRADDAVAHARRALEIEESIYGPDSSEVARVLGVLGDALSLKNDNAGALALYQREVKIIAATLGEKDAMYASALGQVASSLVATKRADEALPYLDRAIAIQTAKLGAEHYETLILMLRRCDALLEINKLDAAIDTCQRALASGEKSLGKDSPNLFDFAFRMGRTYVAAKRPRDAAPILERAVALAAAGTPELPDAELLAARSIWDAGGDRSRAVALAHKARDAFAALGAPAAEQVRTVDAWLKAHAR